MRMRLLILLALPGCGPSPESVKLEAAALRPEVERVSATYATFAYPLLALDPDLVQKASGGDGWLEAKMLVGRLSEQGGTREDLEKVRKLLDGVKSATERLRPVYEAHAKKMIFVDSRQGRWIHTGCGGVVSNVGPCACRTQGPEEKAACRADWHGPGSACSKCGLRRPTAEVLMTAD